MSRFVVFTAPQRMTARWRGGPFRKAFNAVGPIIMVAGCGGRVDGRSDGAGASAGMGATEGGGAVGGDSDPTAGGTSGGGAGALGTGGSDAMTFVRDGYLVTPDGEVRLGARLSDLSDKEARAVCLEEARRTDYCMEIGLRSWDPAECRTRYEECTARGAENGIVTCDGVRSTDCSVTVAQLFECIDAWNETQTCENAGVYLPPPEPCEVVLECAIFDNEFSQFGRAPRCDSASAPERLDSGDDVYGVAGCRPVPDRIVALGNSVITCGDETCAPALLARDLSQRFGVEIPFENLAVAGELGGFGGLPAQAARAGTTDGHLAVFIFSLPDDLSFDVSPLPEWREQLVSVMSLLEESASGGVTFLLNTQYSPSDQCPDAAQPFAEGGLSLEEEEALQALNQELFIALGLEREDTVTVDHYPDWLGHGWNGGVEGCPHCYQDNTLWQSDPIHPNELGQAAIHEKWRVAFETLYGADCGGSL